MTTILKATTTHAATIATIGKQSFIESHGHSAAAADIDAYVERKYSMDAVTEELVNPHHIYHLIYYNRQVAGYSKIILNAPHKNVPAPNVTCLDRLYLLQEFYGLKLGEQLMDYNINIAKRANQAGMWLYTWTENKRAVAFYKKSGFAIVGSANFKISETHANPNHVMYLKCGAAE